MTIEVYGVRFYIIHIILLSGFKFQSSNDVILRR